VLRALQGINDQRPGEYLERVFSLRCFGDSKYFENNARGRAISIIRRYLVGEDTVLEAPSDDEILSQVGIVKSPEQIEFSGSMTGNVVYVLRLPPVLAMSTVLAFEAASVCKVGLETTAPPELIAVNYNVWIPTIP
jgi:hypothetical protein